MNSSNKKDSVYPEAIQDLIESFAAIETVFNIKLDDSDYEMNRQQLLQIFHYETLRAVVSHTVPWIHDVKDSEGILIEEMMIRILNRHFVEKAHLEDKLYPFWGPDIQQELLELGSYGIKISEKKYRAVLQVWKTDYSETAAVEPMAQWIRTEYRSDRLSINLKDN